MSRASIRLFSLCLCVAALLLSAGCQSPVAPNAVERTAYFGPTEPLDQVVARINENNRKVPTLWASHYYEATIADDRGKTHFVNGSGVLLYRSPSELRFVGEKDLIGTVFDLGTNAKSYWLKVIPEVDTLWIGDLPVPSDSQTAQRIPIDPSMILQVLALQPIDEKLSDLPAPTMRFNNDADAYMLTWSLNIPGRWITQREVWYDRKTKAPLFVFLFDVNGRVVLRARLSSRTQIEVDSMSKDQWPWVAAEYRLFFPDSRSRMSISLKQIQLSKGEGNRAVPNDRTFKAPDRARPGVAHVVTVP